MNQHARPTLVSSESPLYPALRWAYQPIKTARRAVQELRWQPRIRRIVADYLADEGFKGLHVGCGPFRLEGWLNTELLGHHAKADFPLDITRPLPFPDNSLDAVYASEVIEHISHEQAIRFLAEANRVLHRGGVIRLTTPDVAEVCRVFLGESPAVDLERFKSVWIDGEFSPEIWINAQFHAYGHQHLWSFEELSSAMKRLGFDQTVRCEPMRTNSGIAQLNGLETRYGPDAPAWLFARTLIIEGEKGARATLARPSVKVHGRPKSLKWTDPDVAVAREAEASSK